MRKIVIALSKGGVGKTTTAVNVAASIAEAGHQTLLVDLDPQCNATVAMGLPKDLSPSTYDCLSGGPSLEDAASYISGTPFFKAVTEVFEDYEELGTLFPVEINLEIDYYRRLKGKLEKLAK